MILFPQELKDNKQFLGGKTLSLGILLEYGFNVPPFVAIPSTVVSKIIDSGGTVDHILVDQLCQEIISKFPCAGYAVRSSALIEDSKESAYAGQFETKIDRSKEQLGEAIIEVVRQAYDFLNEDISQFSLLIQQYIQADFAGVTFTRNPLGGREMVLEFVRGKGEDLVSGKKNSQKIKFYWEQCKVKEVLQGIKSAIEIFKKIEKIFNSPQDIEWCIKDGGWHFLQSRPITTVTEESAKEYEFLGEHLPKNHEYFFEKTEISEIAQRPTEITKSILELIYAVNGPVDEVYKKHKVKYCAHKFFEIIGNELYVDREKEIKTLLPAYTYLNKDFKPHIGGVKGLVKTFMNVIYLNKISLKEGKTLRDQIVYKLGAVFQGGETLGERIKNFMEDYKLIFEINLLADKATKYLTTLVAKYDISCAELLKSKYDLPGVATNIMKGNSLEISDESVFAITKPKNTQKSDLRWTESIPKFKAEFIRENILTARTFNELREYGRWLTVKHISHIRDKVLVMAESKKFTNPRSIYFATLEELKADTYTEEKCSERQEKYNSSNVYNFPSKLMSRYMEEENPLLGVSAGIAEGELVNIDGLEKKGKKILYTGVLAPNLTEYFPKITGILSENGSLLSHLAIMARENNIPVIVNFKLGGSANIGDYLYIDGAKGMIYKKKEQ
jgi:phosphohistidine swiveling domain-containing protein